MVKTEGVPVYRANWGKWKKVKSWGKQKWLLIKRSFFLFSLLLSIAIFSGAFFIKDAFCQNMLISIAGGFFVYFCTSSLVSMRNRGKLRRILKKKHDVFKFNVILLFLRCLNLRLGNEDVERLLIPKEFWDYFWVTTERRTRIDEVINVFNTDEEKLLDLKIKINSFFEDISMSLVGGVVPTVVGCKLLAWRKEFYHLQHDSVSKSDARYIVEKLFMWFADWSNLDEGPYSFEHLIDEI